MGQRQNLDDIVYGDDCDIGFAAGETPKYIYVRFSGIVYCPGYAPEAYPSKLNDRAFKLTQSSSVPCFWSYNLGDWDIEFEVIPTPTLCTLVGFYRRRVFFYFVPVTELLPEEGHIYSNDIDECNGGNLGFDGIAVVTWRLLSLTVLSLINMITANDLFLELFPVKGDHLVFKYCRKRDGTNIKIKFEI